MIGRNASGYFPPNQAIGNDKVTVEWPAEWAENWQPFVNGLVDLPSAYGIDIINAVYFADSINDVNVHAADPANAVVSQPRASVIFKALVDAMKRLPVMPYDQGA